MKKPPFRFWIGVMIFFTTFTNYLLRSNISVSIVAMAGGGNKTKHIPICRENKTISETKITKGVFDWTENQVSDIIGAYFYGYLVALLPAGLLSEWLGPYTVIFWSSVISTVLTALTPLSTEIGHVGVVICRVLVGLAGGIAYPACNVLMAKWAPPNEKGKFMAAMLGSTLGTVMAFNVVGVVSDVCGWEWGFYVLVIIMVAYCLAFFFIVSDTPEQSRWTSEGERQHIREAQQGHVSKKKAIPPYRRMLTSCPMWALIGTQFGSLWTLNLILTYGPKFLSETMDFDLKRSASLASLPYLARMIGSTIFGTIGDWMRKKEIMSLTRLRKFFIIFSHFGPATCFFLMGVAKCNYNFAIALLVLNQGFHGSVVVSQLVNPQDLAPNFSGTCFSIMNVFAMTTGFIVPRITGALNTHYNRSLEASTIIFAIGGIVSSLTAFVFIFFGSAEVQPWNEIPETPTSPPPST